MMTNDAHYDYPDYQKPQLSHGYGDNFFLLNHPVLSQILAKLSQTSCHQPHITQLMKEAYGILLHETLNAYFPRVNQSVQTRMKACHAEGQYEASLLDPQTEIVTVNLARAGSVPSQTCFELLHSLYPATRIRQDHVFINRKTNASEEVTGVNLAGVKIGGSVKGKFVLFPDPMGATGSTLVEAMNIYHSQVEGKPRQCFAIHLIVTPEYLKKIEEECPGLTVIAGRLDRGLSSAEVLKSSLGEHWDQERGLNEKHYIVPGAGGLGELMNSAEI